MDQSTSFSAFWLVSSWIRAPLLVLFAGYSNFMDQSTSVSALAGYGKFMDQSTSFSDLAG